METISLVRASSTLQGTFGKLRYGDSSCFTLELPWKNNERCISCIPVGTYDIVWLHSPTRGWCYHLISVPDRSGVLIHAANLAGSIEDGFASQLRGCIALGKRIGTMQKQAALLVSRPAVLDFETWAARRTLRLEIS